MKSTDYFLLAFALFVNSNISVKSQKVDCITVECRMKTVKVPKNILQGDPTAYYSSYPHIAQPIPYNYPAYHYYYGYAAAPNPGYTNGHQHDAYAAYHNHAATYWATAYPYPYETQAPQTGATDNVDGATRPYCPTCSQRLSLQPTTPSHSTDSISSREIRTEPPV